MNFFFVKTLVLDHENLGGIPWTFVKYREIVFPIFVHFHEVVEIQPILDNIWQFLSDLNNIYLKYFRILQNLTRFYES